VPGFRPGGEFTVGVEEELMLLRHDGSLTPRQPDEVVAALRGLLGASCAVTSEIFAAQVEFATPVCARAEDAVEVLRRCREALRALERPAAAVAVHPGARLGDFRTTSSARYDSIVADLAGFLRTPTAALQVHVGMPDRVTAVAAYRGLRHHLAVLRALAASSPHWHGRDSGLASSRAAILRSYPRTGVPPAFRSWAEYECRAQALVDGSGVANHTYVWWDLRPRPDLGTLEVRVMDAQWSLARVAGLVALVQGLAVAAAERPPAGDLPDAVLDENDFQAVRHGLDARVVAGDGSRRPVRELAVELVRDAQDAQRGLGPGRDGPLLDLLGAIAGDDECRRQRRVRADQGVGGLVADLARRTGSPLPTPTPAAPAAPGPWMRAGVG
jgi:carboxylate-amine ligase